MTESFGEMLKNKLIESQMLTADRFCGCTDEEIDSIVKAQKVEHLPKVFREYLETMGKGGLGSIAFIGSHWGCPRLLHLKNELISEIEDFEYDFALQEDAFVFFCHGGAEYHYFLTAEEDNDPPVFLYMSESTEAEQINERLSEYFLGFFNAYKRIFDKARKSKD